MMARKFASYAFLCPGAWQSADKRRDLPVGRHGNLYLKGALTEATRTAARRKWFSGKLTLAAWVKALTVWPLR